MCFAPIPILKEFGFLVCRLSNIIFFQSSSGYGKLAFTGRARTTRSYGSCPTLTLTNLQLILLLDCPDVTDQGISTLANIHSLKGLGLEGTSITDAGVDVMAARMKLTSVNVASCGGVTQNGIRALARCPSLKKLSFSADRWTQDEIIGLIDTFENVNWCGIVDRTNRLDRQLLEDKGKAKGIQVVVTRTGALEDNRRFRKEHSLR